MTWLIIILFLELQLQFNSACLFEDEHAQIDFGGKSYNIM